MSSLFPCPEFLRDCDCQNFPVRNFSIAAPDVPVFWNRDGGVPPTTGTFFATGCQSICESTISQEDADLCAARQAVECVVVDPPGPNPVFVNVVATCTVLCPDGSEFSETVEGGTVASHWQGDAQARAYGLACKRATAHRMCFITTSPLTPICAGVLMSELFEITGGTAPVAYSITAGSLPPGLELSPLGVLFGTPTTGGTYTFTVRATDANGLFQSKTFVQAVMQITSPTSLPAATIGVPYTYTLLKSGFTTFRLCSALPPGLTLSGGVISGTPTGDSGYTAEFRIAAATPDGGCECGKDFTMAIEPLTGLLAAYWTFDDFDAFDNVLDSTSNNNDLAPFGAYNIVAGKVNNAVEIVAGFGLDSVVTAGIENPNLGFTVAGWFKTAADAVNGGNIWSLYFVGYSFALSLVSGGDIKFKLGIEEIFAAYPQDGGWHFYAVWYSPSDLKIHMQIDGGAIVESAPIVIGNSALNLFEVAVGTTLAGNRVFDETGYWSRVLSPAEIAAIYNGGAGITWGNPALPP